MNTKQSLFISILLSFFISFVNAQTTDLGVNYMAVARNDAGEPLSGQSIDVGVSIYEGVGGTVEVYRENHTVTTDAYGQFQLVIGKGSGTMGDFSVIDWGSDLHFLEITINSGDGPVTMGKVQFNAVPYSKYANVAGKVADMKLGDLSDVDFSGPPEDNDVLRYNGSEWIPYMAQDPLWFEDTLDVYRTVGNVGIGTNEPRQRLSVKGNVELGYAIEETEGAIRFNPFTKDFEGFDGTEWKSLTKSTLTHASIFEYDTEGTSKRNEAYFSNVELVVPEDGTYWINYFGNANPRSSSEPDPLDLWWRLSVFVQRGQDVFRIPGTGVRDNNDIDTNSSYVNYHFSQFTLSGTAIYDLQEGDVLKLAYYFHSAKDSDLSIAINLLRLHGIHIFKLSE